MKGRTTLLIMMLHLASQGLCSTTSECTNTTVQNKGYQEVRLSTVGLTAESYRNFIAAIRAALKIQGHTVTLPCQQPPPLERYVLVTLSNEARRSVTLWLDTTGAYFTAYRAGDYCCFFNKRGAVVPVTCYYAPGISSRVLMTSSGMDMHPGHHLAEEYLGEARWGASELDEAVTSLHKFAYGQLATNQLQLLAEGIRACIMMVENAAWFQYIERRMSIGIRYHADVVEDPSFRALARSWLDLSAAIQESGQSVFAAPVMIRRRSNEVVQLDNLNMAVPMIAMLYCHCFRQFDEKPRPPGEAQACVVAEPTSRLVGPDGKCVTVRDGRYVDENAVELRPCKPYADVSQLWTFKVDGTIRSNGKCLTTSNGNNTTGAGGDHGAAISTCPDSLTDAVVWQVWDDGTVVSNFSSGQNRLVLSATGTTLVVRPDDHSTGQCFSPTNTTKPFVSSIVGYNDLCLQADGEDVWVDGCVSGKPEQAWAYYPDGSIRPEQRHDRCLAFDAEGELKLVKVIPCDHGSYRQRWVVQNDGSILNWRTKLVVDVRGSDPSLREIIVCNVTGKPNQNWALML